MSFVHELETELSNVRRRQNEMKGDLVNSENAEIQLKEGFVNGRVELEEMVELGVRIQTLKSAIPLLDPKIEALTKSLETARGKKQQAEQAYQDKLAEGRQKLADFDSELRATLGELIPRWEELNRISGEIIEGEFEAREKSGLPDYSAVPRDSPFATHSAWTFWGISKFIQDFKNESYVIAEKKRYGERVDTGAGDGE